MFECRATRHIRFSFVFVSVDIISATVMGKHKDRRRVDSSSDEDLRQIIKELKQRRKKRKDGKAREVKRRLSSRYSRSHSRTRSSPRCNRSRSRIRSSHSRSRSCSNIRNSQSRNRSRSRSESRSPVVLRQSPSPEHQRFRSPDVSTREPRGTELVEIIPSKHYFLLELGHGAKLCANWVNVPC